MSGTGGGDKKTMTNATTGQPDGKQSATDLPTTVCVDWYSEGESRTIDCGDVRVTVRFIGRKGRRGRIKIEAPAGAVFRSWGAGES